LTASVLHSTFLFILAKDVGREKKGEIERNLISLIHLSRWSIFIDVDHFTLGCWWRGEKLKVLPSVASVNKYGSSPRISDACSP
jgi:hypothetical protein